MWLVGKWLDVVGILKKSGALVGNVQIKMTWDTFSFTISATAVCCVIAHGFLTIQLLSNPSVHLEYMISRGTQSYLLFVPLRILQYNSRNLRSFVFKLWAFQKCFLKQQRAPLRCSFSHCLQQMTSFWTTCMHILPLLICFHFDSFTFLPWHALCSITLYQ